MTKGLQRSLSRAKPGHQEIFRIDVNFDAVISIVGQPNRVDAGNFKIYELPHGNLRYLGGVVYLAIEGSNIVTDWRGDFGIGVVISALAW